MVGKPEALDDARARFAGVVHVEIVDGRFGDIWLRDTGPIFGAGSATAAAFRFNGWGGQFEMEFDDTVADQIGEQSGTPLCRNDFILEGGALDHDGAGTILTTRQCLLNPNRNIGWTEAKAEALLGEALGATVDRLEAEKDAISGVVITSAKKTFFAGGDLNELRTITPEDAEAFSAGAEVLKGDMRRLEQLGKPVVACINGAALGGGLEITLACHRRISVADGVVLGFPEVQLGLLPGAGGVVRSVRRLSTSCPRAARRSPNWPARR